MDNYITSDDIRYAVGFTEAEAPDAMLKSAAFIPSGDAWLNSVLSSNGTSFQSLSEDNQALAKAAECFHIGIKIIQRPPSDDFSAGGISSKSVSSQDKAESVKTFQARIKEIFDLLGFSTGSWATANATPGGGDYSPSGIDNTNIDISTGVPFSMDGSEENTFDALGDDDESE